MLVVATQATLSADDLPSSTVIAAATIAEISRSRCHIRPALIESCRGEQEVLLSPLGWF